MLSVLIIVFICQLIEGVYWFYSTVTKGSFFFFHKGSSFSEMVSTYVLYFVAHVCLCMAMCS